MSLFNPVSLSVLLLVCLSLPVVALALPPASLSLQKVKVASSVCGLIEIQVLLPHVNAGILYLMESFSHILVT